MVILSTLPMSLLAVSKLSLLCLFLSILHTHTCFIFTLKEHAHACLASLYWSIFILSTGYSISSIMYGAIILWCDNIIVCSYTGFLFVGTFPHPDLIALTQNISPLQADFNPGLNDTARVLVYSTGKYWCIAQALPAS